MILVLCRSYSIFVFAHVFCSFVFFIFYFFFLLIFISYLDSTYFLAPILYMDLDMYLKITYILFIISPLKVIFSLKMILTFICFSLLSAFFEVSHRLLSSNPASLKIIGITNPSPCSGSHQTTHFNFLDSAIIQ